MSDTEEGNEGAYSRCANCGRYFPTKKMIHRQFCSNECAEVFTRCVNCGKFFIGNGSFCSEECAKTHFEEN